MAIRPPAMSAPPFRKAAALLVSAAACASFAVGSAQPARAEIQADIRAAQAQLKVSREQTEAVTEKFNAAQLQLAQARRAQAAAASAVAKADAEAQASQGALAAFAANAYRTGGLDSVTALVTGDPQSFLDRTTSLDLLSRQQAGVIRKVRLVAHDQQQAQLLAADTGRQAQRIVDALNVQRTAITAGIAREQALLNGLVARQERLIAEARNAAARAAALAQAAAFRAEARAAVAASAVLSVTSDTQSAGPAAAAATQPAPAPAPAPSAGGGSGGVSTALEWARREMGKPYVYGAAGPDSFDCSGLTQYVFGKGGIALDHYTGSQWNSGRHVSRGELRPGDLVFFYSDLHHVGLYVGGGQMIDAPHSGASVRQEDVWWGDYAGAVRVTG